MAVSYAAGSKANFGTTTKSLHAGLAARAGIETALLTQAGATANTSMLDDQFGGYFNLYTPEVDRDGLIGGIGETFVVVDPGVSFKLLPCCGSIHSSVWAVIRLFEEGGYRPDEIASIRAFVDPKRIAHTSRTEVHTGLEAKFSSQYCQAVAALTGRLVLADFDETMVNLPERQNLLRRVSILPADDVSEWPNPDDSHTGSRGALVEIEDVHGHVVRMFNLVPRGYAADPASDEVLLGKFVDCACRDGRSEVDAKTLASELASIDDVRNVRQMVERVWTS
jgi:2-methylcitrate dehydratase PrpD